MKPEQTQENAFVVLGEATDLTHGDFFPYAMEAFVIPDFYDIP